MPFRSAPGRAGAAGGPGGQQQPLIADALAGGQLDLAVGWVDGADRGGGVQLDVVGGVEPVRVQVEAVAIGFAAQVALGQGRAVVRPLGFVAEQQQAAAEALGAQGLGRLGGRQAGAVEADASGTAQAALQCTAGALGAELGAEAAEHLESDGGPGTVLAVRQALAARGYEPYQEADGTIRLRNCPFDRIAAQHRQLVCRANHAMLQGLTNRLGGDQPVRAVLDPQPGTCCVALTSNSQPADPAATGAAAPSATAPNTRAKAPGGQRRRTG